MIVHVNGQRREVAPTAVLSDLLELDAHGAVPRGIAVAVDGEVVPRSRLTDTAVADGARVEVVTAVQGG